MSIRDEYPTGVPCWVETLQPDPRAALDFYGPLFGWEFSGPDPSTRGAGGDYVVARVDGRDVAGIGPLSTNGGPPAAIWSTSISVGDIDAAVGVATHAGASLLLGPLDALPAGRLAALVDPTGAPFALWEAGDRIGAQLVNEPRTWAMSSLHTPDPIVAGAFYATLFHWQPEPLGPGVPVTMLRLPNYLGGEPGQPVPRDVVGVMTPIEQGPQAPAIPPHWNVNFRVDDADAITRRAVQLGGTVLMAPATTPGFRSAALFDPQGAAFSISQLLPVG